MKILFTFWLPSIWRFFSDNYKILNFWRNLKITKAKKSLHSDIFLENFKILNFGKFWKLRHLFRCSVLKTTLKLIIWARMKVNEIFYCVFKRHFYGSNFTGYCLLIRLVFTSTISASKVAWPYAICTSWRTFKLFANYQQLCFSPIYKLAKKVGQTKQTRLKSKIY